MECERKVKETTLNVEEREYKSLSTNLMILSMNVSGNELNDSFISISTLTQYSLFEICSAVSGTLLSRLDMSSVSIFSKSDSHLVESATVHLDKRYEKL